MVAVIFTHIEISLNRDMGNAFCYCVNSHTVPTVKQLDEVDRFNYLGSCTSPDSRISNKVSLLMQKARLDFTNLMHLCCRHDIRP